MQPLAGLRVLDLTWHIAGPYCTKLLADYGADVLKVERPAGGDPARAAGPFPGDIPHPERSGLFLHLNTNKQSVTVDIKTDAGQEIVRQLVRDSDIVIESFAPRVLPPLGLDYAALSKINPRIVMCSISNFGQSGPYRDWKATNFTIEAMGGLPSCTGDPEFEPLKQADHLMEYLGGQAAATAVMGAALHQRWASQGQHIDLSLFEVSASCADRRMTALLGYQYTGQVADRVPNLPIALPYGYFPAADGFACFIVAPPARWTRFMDMVGRPDLKADQRFHDPGFWSTPEAKEEMDVLFYPWLIERTKQQAFEEGQKHRIACCPVNTAADVLTDPHLNARGFFQHADHPEAGLLPYTGPSFRLEREGFALRSTAPLLGQHNSEVLGGRLGLSPQECTILRATGCI